MPPKFYRRYLTLNKQRGLAIATEGLVEEVDGDQEAFLRVVLRDRHRWLCLFVELPNGHVNDERLPAMGNCDFPMLEMLVAVGASTHTKLAVLVLDQNLFVSAWSAPRLASALF